MFGNVDDLKLTLPGIQYPSPGRPDFFHGLLADPINESVSREKRSEGIVRNVPEKLHPGHVQGDGGVMRGIGHGPTLPFSERLIA